MSLQPLDKLLTTLDVDLHAFAVCNVAAAGRLVFEPMNVVVVHYVLVGSGILDVQGSPLERFEKGAILVVPPRRGQSLAVSAESHVDLPAGEHCRMLVGGLVEFDATSGAPSELMTICATLTATYGGSFGLFDNLEAPLVEDLTANPSVRSAFDQLLAERAAPDIGTHALTEALMKQCLVLLIRSHIRRASTGSPFLRQRVDPRLANAVVSILRQPAAPVSLLEMAHNAGMSRSAFSNAFKSAFGQSPIDFVQKTRLHHAARLLESTELPVKVVAASMGFASRSHFSRAFRNAYDIDPSAYREARLQSGAEAPANDGRGWLSRLVDPEPVSTEEDI